MPDETKFVWDWKPKPDEVVLTDDDIRMLLLTYHHCRKFAHAGEVGRNAVAIIAALEELLLRRMGDE